MSKILEIAQKTLATEQEGLAAIETVLDDNFQNIINSLKAIKGRIIVSGMGKSGHIARKIAATMASIGTPAYFVHPSEASHGDLGMISKDDAIILLSNSGETKELSDIISYAKRFNILLIGIVRRKSSMLVKASTYSVVLPEIAEASVVGAPTTSTTMMLVLGDLIAVTLAELKGFNKEHFGVFHPGGKLGSQFVLVADVMRKGEEIPLVGEDVLIREATSEMSAKVLGCTGVVNSAGELVGVITDGDLRRHIDSLTNNSSVLEVMTRSPLTISDTSLAQEAVAIMQERKVTVMFVVTEDNKPIGVLNVHDCFKAGIL